MANQNTVQPFVLYCFISFTCLVTGMSLIQNKTVLCSFCPKERKSRLERKQFTQTFSLSGKSNLNPPQSLLSRYSLQISCGVIRLACTSPKLLSGGEGKISVSNSTSEDGLFVLNLIKNGRVTNLQPFSSHDLSSFRGKFSMSRSLSAKQIQKCRNPVTSKIQNRYHIQQSLPVRTLGIE